MMFYLLGKCDVEDGIYCIAGNETKELREYINEMAVVYGSGAKCEFASVDDSKKLLGIDPDISRTTAAINYEPRVTFDVGIKRMIEFKIRECNLFK